MTSMNFDHRPYVTLNVAMTADGKTDTVARRGAAISSPQDLERVDRLRATHDAIMVGGKTLLGDDPRLTVKSAALRAERLARGAPENPIKVGVVTRADLKLDGRFLTVGPARRMIFTTSQTSATQIEKLRECGAEVIVAGERRVDLPMVLRHLKRDGVERLMVEGGGTLNFELLRLGGVDEINIYLAPLILGGTNSPTLADGIGLPRDQAIRLQLKNVEPQSDGGILLRYQVLGQEI